MKHGRWKGGFILQTTKIKKKQEAAVSKNAHEI
jgi:hypothetical protein